ncbi:hypothetical protein TNCV_948001 [Trichonephila clavipes]|nr:hypothetical protein TNCV_948001 [Trichonephila clavipes]
MGERGDWEEQDEEDCLMQEKTNYFLRLFNPAFVFLSGNRHRTSASPEKNMEGRKKNPAAFSVKQAEHKKYPQRPVSFFMYLQSPH